MTARSSHFAEPSGRYRSPVTLQPYEIDPLADYVATKIMGAGAVTRAECLEFFGGKGSQCDKYPER
jgi:hypothetical protein